MKTFDEASKLTAVAIVMAFMEPGVTLTRFTDHFIMYGWGDWTVKYEDEILSTASIRKLTVNVSKINSEMPVGWVVIMEPWDSCSIRFKLMEL